MKAKGRRGGLGESGAALQEKRRVAERKHKQEIAKKIRANEKLVRQIGKHWAAQKGIKHYERLIVDQRAKASPLAAALSAAMDAKDKPEG